MVAITLVAFTLYHTWRRYVTWRYTLTADQRWLAATRRQAPAVSIPHGRRGWDLARFKATATARTRTVRPGPQFRSELANPPA